MQFEIERLSKLVPDLENSLQKIKDDSTNRERARFVRDSLTKLPARNAVDVISLRNANNLLGSPLPNLEYFRKQLSVATDSLRHLTDLDSRIKTRISSFLNPENQYRKDISFYFVLLIGLFIGSFFGIIAFDKSLRLRIFGGEAGLQFITIFALLIAIILFGMTKVLEGKELSALLGGLSGYILGRSSGKSESKTDKLGAE